MKRFNFLKNIYKFSFVITGIILSSCNSTSNIEIKPNTGGTFSYCSVNRLQHFHPTLISDESTKLVANQIFEGLVKLNHETLETEPSIAGEVSFDQKKFIYTFKIKEGVYFHDNPCFKNGKGRKLNADDIIYTFKNLCTKQLVNSAYHTVLKGVVKGVEDYFLGQSDNIQGIRKIDNSTIEIELHRPNGLFLRKLTGINFSIVAKEALKKYGIGNNVGTGPFIPLKFDKYNDQQILIKNLNYHGIDKNGNKLPYLDSIQITFDTSLKEQIKLVVNKKLSTVLNLPFKAVKRVIRDNKDKFDKDVKMQNAPFLSSHFIEFNINKGILKNRHLRKAINYGLNKQELTFKVFGETRGKTGNAGISHPNLINYRKNGVNGYSFNLDSAKSHLKRAKLDSNSLDIELDISQDDYKALSIADEIRFQLGQNLGLNIKINVVPQRYKLEKSRYAKGDMYISNVTASYPSPEGFLNIFYGKTVPKSLNTPSYPNTTRFINRDFDRMMDRARRSIDEENANQSFAAAERLLMDECPIAMLWYEETNRLIDSTVKNFTLNKVQLLYFSKVYISK